MQMKSTLKKATALVLTLIMVFGVAPAEGFMWLPDFFDGFSFSAHAASEDDLTFRLVNGGTEYEIIDCDETAAGELIIPSTYNGKSVTSIGDEAFYDCTGLESITIPDSVTNIGYGAFSYCTGLSSITIPDSVESIGEDAFSSCTVLGSVTIPNSVTSIGNYAFDGCIGLSEVTIGNSVNSIGYRVFYGCTGLSEVIIGNSVTSIGEKAFYNCMRLSAVTIPNSVNSIGKYAFFGCMGLGVVTIPDSVVSVGEGAFGGTDWYNNLPDGIVYIGKIAYKYKGTIPVGTSITIRNGTKSIAEKAFYNCTNLSSVTIGNSVTSIGSSAFFGCTGLSSITIPNRVTSIGDSSFSGCTGLISITIGNRVTLIGDSAFEGCTGISYVYYDGNEIDSEEIEIGSYNENLTNATWYYNLPVTAVTVLPTSKALAVGTTQQLTATIIPTNTINDDVTWSSSDTGIATVDENGLVTAIAAGTATITVTTADGGKTASCAVTVNDILTFTLINGDTAYEITDCDLTITGMLVIPPIYNGKPVTSIGYKAFANCTNLISVTIPDSVTSFGSWAFSGCTGLSSVTIPDSVTSIGGYAFNGCAKLTTVNFNAKNCTTMGSGSLSAFYNCTALSTVVIGEGVTIIPSFAFYGCTGLVSITIPDSVTSIGNSAFDNTAWYNNQPDGLVYIGKIAYGYKGTMPTGTAIDIKNDTKSMADYVFSGCKGLVSITIPDSVTSIGEYAFYRCTGLISITIPDSVTNIGDDAFYYCTSLVSITIPDSVTSIGNYAFNGCTGLSDITVNPVNANYSSQDGVLFNKDKTCLMQYPAGNTRTSYSIPDNVTSIGNYAFSGCTGLSSVTIGNSVTSIGSSAFIGCTGLSSVTIGNSVTSIGDYAFYCCTELSSITIPDSVTSIGSNAFYWCTGLSDITVNPVNANYSSQDGVLFNKDKTHLMQYPARNTRTSYSIPDGVTSIGGNAFYGCDGLNSITIPDSVKSIGDYAFDGCWRLSKVYYGGSESERAKISISLAGNGYLLNATWYYNLPVTGVSLDITGKVLVVGTTQQLTATIIPTNTMNYDVTWSSSDTEIATVDENGLVTAIATGTATITVTTADGGKTASCMITVFIPVADVAVSPASKTLVVGATQQLTATVAPEDATNKSVRWTSSNTSIATVDENGLVTAIAAGTATITVTTADGSKTASCTVTVNDITSILAFTLINDDTAYEVTDCNFTTTGMLVIPPIYNGKPVTSIGYRAFADCTNLSSITIPDSVTSIGSNAFYWCTGLSDITVNPVNANYSSQDGVLFNQDKTYLMQYPAGNTRTSYSIPDSVTSIGEGAFDGCTRLSSVTIPNSVTSIGEGAFEGCTGLSSITIGNSVTSIGEEAFAGCTGLSSITIPDSVTSIGYGAFANCKGLSDITVSSANAYFSIQDGVLFNKAKTHLIQYPAGNTKTSYSIPDSVTSISKAAFAFCTGLVSITISDSVTSIGEWAFFSCTSLSTVIIGNSVTSIGEKAFYECTGLVSITIPDSVKSIGDEAFYGCSGLSSVTIGYSVKSIGRYAFNGCTGISYVYYDGNVIDSEEIEIGSYNENLTNATWYYNLPVTAVTVLPTSKALAVGTTQQLTATIIPTNTMNDDVTWSSSDTEIATVDENGLVTAIAAGTAAITVTTADSGKTASCAITVVVPVTGVSLDITSKSLAIGGTQQLTATVAPEDATNKAVSWSSSDTEIATVDENGIVTAKAMGRVIITATTADGSKTASCTVTVIADESILVFTLINDDTAYEVSGYNNEITGTLIIPATYNGKPVTSIGNYAFRGYTGLSTVTIPDSVTNIGTYAFSGCTGLVSITIPDRVVKIGNRAFYGCAKLTTVNFNAKNCTTMGSGPYSAFNNCTALSTVVIGEGVTIIPSYAFYGCTSLSSVTIPDSVTSIGIGAFLNTAWYNNLPDGLVYIGKVAYKYKGTMPTGTAIDIKNDTKSMANNVFSGCKGLVSVTIPNSVTSIGSSAFSDCTGLVSVTIPNSVTSIGMNAFIGCSGLSDITVNPVNANYSSQDGVLFNKDKTCLMQYPAGNTRTSYSIPDSVNSIDYAAFFGCTGLVSITIPDSVNSIGYRVFYGCTGLSEITIGNSVTSIGSSAFFNCSGLSSVTIGNSVTSIGSLAFNGCSGLTDVYYGGDESDRAKIAISSNDGYLLIATWHYSVRVTGITLDPTDTTLTVGEKQQLTASVAPENATNKSVRWTTSNTSIATVDQNGLVTANAMGRVIITATTADGLFSATYGMQIEPTNAVVSIINYSGSFNVKLNWWKKYSTATMTLGFYAYNCEAAVRYVWSSDNSRVKIDQNGNITNTGSFSRSATITLTAYDAENNVVAKSSVKVSFYKFSWQESKLQSQAIVSDNIAQQSLSENELERHEAKQQNSEFAFITDFVCYLLDLFMVILLH